MAEVDLSGSKPVCWADNDSESAHVHHHRQDARLGILAAAFGAVMLIGVPSCTLMANKALNDNDDPAPAPITSAPAETAPAPEIPQ